MPRSLRYPGQAENLPVRGNGVFFARHWHGSAAPTDLPRHWPKVSDLFGPLTGVRYEDKSSELKGNLALNTLLTSMGIA